MKWTAKTCLWFVATALLAAMAFGRGQDDGGLTKAERLMNTSCSSCHELRKIQTQALDADGWKSVVTSMIEKGAKVEPDNLPILLDYLVKQHGPLPDGPGKTILLNTCTRCHDLKRVKEHGATRRQWAETLLAMLNEGAPLSDEELPVILEYLTATFPPLR